MKPFHHLILTLIIFITGGIARAESEQAQGHHLFILSGQSNMRKPLPTAFQAAVGKVLGNDKVICVTVAHPSQPIRRWYKKWKLPEGLVQAPSKNGKAPPVNGEIYDALMERVKKSTTGKEIATVTYIWMQGEADAQSGWGDAYEESFYGILDQIKSDLKVGQVNYVLGRINDYWTSDRGIVHGDLIRKLQQKIGEAHDYGDWVDTDDLNTGVNPWGIFMFCDGHFPPPAYSVLGERFARKACLLIDLDLEFGQEVFMARHYDHPDEIASHAAIGSTISGDNPARGSLAQLTDGKFGSPDPKDEHWTRLTAKEESPIELILDLGTLQTVQQLGLSLLYHPAAGAVAPKRMTMEISPDAEQWQNLNRRNFSFKTGAPRGAVEVQAPKPQSMIALVPGPTNRGVPVAMRYLRIRIEAPEVFIDEVIAEPVPSP